MNQVFQILITKDNNVHLPETITELTEYMMKKFIGYEYSLWTDERIKDFLNQNFDKDVLNSYMLLKPFAYKSDLARYCLLYHFGGWYVDLGTKFVDKVPINIEEKIEMVYFWDLGNGFSPYRKYYDCMNGMLFSKPQNPVFQNTINKVIEHCRENYYGTDPMCPTGPGVLGRSIAIHGQTDKHYDGHFMMLTPNHKQRNRAYVLKDGMILAWHRSCFNKRMQSLSDLGIIGGNDYRYMWGKGLVY